MYLFDESVGRYLVKPGAASWELAGLGCVLMRIQLASLCSFSVLLGVRRAVSDAVGLPLAATDAHVRGEGAEVE